MKILGLIAGVPVFVVAIPILLDLLDVGGGEDLLIRRVNSTDTEQSEYSL